jgi:hypothetical protein
MPRKKALVAKELNTRQAKIAEERRKAATHARAVKQAKSEERKKALDVLAKDLGISRRTQNFVDLLNDNPDISNQQAYIKTHATNNTNTAAVEAHRILKSPKVQIYTRSAVNRAINKVVTLIDSEQENIALRASESVLDRQFGKATFKSESVAKTVEVKLDLTGVKIGTHYLPSVAQ